MEKEKPSELTSEIIPPAKLEEVPSHEVINASGHIQEVRRNFSIWAVLGTALCSGNTWIAFGGSVVVAIYNGGPPGVIYQLIVDSVFYWLIAASVAELASAIPSSGGVYHWASITAGRYGRPVGWFAGWWNFFAWIFAAASTTAISTNLVLSMYSAMHPGYTPARWNLFISYVIFTWIACGICLFCHRAIPTLELIGGILVVAGVIITIIVCAVMPHVNGTPYATNSFVWSEWQNATGYSSDGFAFLLGMLNGAFTVGTPDVITHLAEEVRSPSVALPKTIFFQMLLGFLTCLFFMIAIFYSINDLDAVLNTSLAFPLGEIYRQATGSQAGSVGLLVVAFVPFITSCVGTYLIASRVLWSLARDNATPFSRFFASVNQRDRIPFNAIVLCGVICTAFGFIFLGSKTAFNAFVGSFVILSTLSYLAAILPHLLRKRRGINPGWFWMRGVTGFVVNGISCAYIIVFIVIFCFPFAMPVTADNMNYSVVITGGLSLFVGGWWFWRRGEYLGPKHVPLNDRMAEEII